MKYSAQPRPPIRTNTADKRVVERRPVRLPARLAWKDQRGVSRFASVVTRDVSDLGVFVESSSSLSIPLYRLVQFQFEPQVREAFDLPETLCQGRILSAVYRVCHAARNTPYGLALRLMVDPKLVAVERNPQARATA